MAMAELDCSPLQDGFAGELILPGNPSYDDARTIFNAMIDRRPAVIAQCQTARDVAKAATSAASAASRSRSAAVVTASPARLSPMGASSSIFAA